MGKRRYGNPQDELMDDQPQSQPAPEPQVVVPSRVELIDPNQTTPESSLRVMGRSQVRHRPRLALGLFLATCLSTFLVGSGLIVALLYPELLVKVYEKGDLWKAVSQGLRYSGAVMSILLAHEMGHYLLARRYRVPASLPYFIPLPLPPLGTLGAVIIQGAELVESREPSDGDTSKPFIRVAADRKQMFDIAIAGPLAGLFVAMPIVWMGISNGTVVPIDRSALRLGDPLILQWLTTIIHGPLESGMELQIGPLGMAGWVGILITALNLIPIGQLDGGHILYALIGKRSHYVSIGLLLGAVLMMVVMRYPAYSLMIILLIVTGPRHPPTANDDVPLGTFRIILGWLTLAFIIIGFTPTPFVIDG